jgi:hypothetical protein
MQTLLGVAIQLQKHIGQCNTQVLHSSIILAPAVNQDSSKHKIQARDYG